VPLEGPRACKSRGAGSRIIARRGCAERARVSGLVVGFGA
jgi:hypothetical protein